MYPMITDLPSSTAIMVSSVSRSGSGVEGVLAAPCLPGEQHVTAAVDLDPLREDGAALAVGLQLEDADCLIGAFAPFTVFPGDPPVRHGRRSIAPIAR